RGLRARPAPAATGRGGGRGAAPPRLLWRPTRGPSPPPPPPATTSPIPRRHTSLRGHELMVSAFRNVIPRAHQRLELREGRVHLSRHWRLLRLLPQDLDR